MREPRERSVPCRLSWAQRSIALMPVQVNPKIASPRFSLTNALVSGASLRQAPLDVLRRAHAENHQWAS
jgi:hypothetical protein